MLKQKGLNTQKEFSHLTFFPPDLVKRILTTLGGDFTDPQLEAARYQPLDLTFHTKNKLAEKYNKAELLELIHHYH
ncbi:MAG: hypothetical protein LBU27_02305 [Candidatus Peribacteria bacterium]|nr:hypothetical protein [Candidatus Peribacteria bacterium]